MFDTLPLERHEHPSQCQKSRHVRQNRIALLCRKEVTPTFTTCPITPTKRSSCSMPRRHHPSLLYIVLVFHLLATSSFCLTLDAPSPAKYQVSLLFYKTTFYHCLVFTRQLACYFLNNLINIFYHICGAISCVCLEISKIKRFFFRQIHHHMTKRDLQSVFFVDSHEKGKFVIQVLFSSCL